MMIKLLRIISWTIFVVLIALFPHLLGIYYANIFVTFAVFAVYALSFNMLLGYTGLLNFGHSIFFAMGAYGTALALKNIDGITLFPALVIGVLAAALLALVLSPLVVRVKGAAFAMLHLAFGQLFYVLALKMRNITGGENGITNFPIPDINILGILSIPIRNEPLNFYYFATIILGVSCVLMWRLTKTPFGQIQKGIKDNAKRIDYLGYKVDQTKAIVYVLSGTFAGISGAIYALFQNMVSVDGVAGLTIAFAPIMATMIGGMGTFVGPVLGTAIFQILEEVIMRFTDRIELVMGTIIILVILFFPNGLMGFILKMRQKFVSNIATNDDVGNK